MDKTLIITNITRAAIDFTYSDAPYTIEGEAYLQGYGSPDFVAYLGFISEVGPPKRRVSFDEQRLNTVKAGLTQAMRERTMTIEFEP